MRRVAPSGYHRGMARTPTPVERVFTPFVRDVLMPLGLIVLDWTSLAARPAIMQGGGGPRPTPPGTTPRAGPERHRRPWRLRAGGRDLPAADRADVASRSPSLRSRPSMAAVYQWLHLPPSLTFLAPLIALYTVGTLARPPRAADRGCARCRGHRSRSRFRRSTPRPSGPRRSASSRCSASPRRSATRPATAARTSPRSSAEPSRPSRRARKRPHAASTRSGCASRASSTT